MTVHYCDLCRIDKGYSKTKTACISICDICLRPDKQCWIGFAGNYIVPVMEDKCYCPHGIKDMNHLCLYCQLAFEKSGMDFTLTRIAEVEAKIKEREATP